MTPSKGFYCAFSFQVAHNMGNGILWRNADVHMHVISHQVSLYNFTFFSLGKFMKNCSQKLPQTSIYDLLPFFGNEDNMILTTPSCMSQTLVVWHKLNLLVLGGTFEVSY